MIFLLVADLSDTVIRGEGIGGMWFAEILEIWRVRLACNLHLLLPIFSQFTTALLAVGFTATCCIIAPDKYGRVNEHMNSSRLFYEPYGICVLYSAPRKVWFSSSIFRLGIPPLDPTERLLAGICKLGEQKLTCSTIHPPSHLNRSTIVPKAL